MFSVRKLLCSVFFQARQSVREGPVKVFNIARFYANETVVESVNDEHTIKEIEILTCHQRLRGST